MDLKAIQKDAEEFIVKQGDYVYSNWSKMTIDKLKDDGADMSTNFDKEIEEKFFEFTDKKYPSFGFVGEENPELIKNGEYTWMVDPIDGTKFFAAGVPLWSNTISLIGPDEEGLIGIIYNPISKQLYSASKGDGAHLNGKKIELTKETDIKKLQVNIDLSATILGEYDFTDRSHKIINILERNFYRARMLGNGALSLAWLAQGFFGAFVDPIRPRSKFVDVAGGFCIAKEAGAVIERVEVEKDIYDTIVARKQVAEVIRDLLQR